MAVTSTAISFYVAASSRPNESLTSPKNAPALAKVALVTVVVAMACAAVRLGAEMAQTVLAPVIDGAVILLSRPMLPVGF
jgi:hypothetical protein